jgi:hypothetical protein
MLETGSESLAGRPEGAEKRVRVRGGPKKNMTTAEKRLTSTRRINGKFSRFGGRFSKIAPHFSTIAGEKKG